MLEKTWNKDQRSVLSLSVFLAYSRLGGRVRKYQLSRRPLDDSEDYVDVDGTLPFGRKSYGLLRLRERGDDALRLVSSIIELVTIFSGVQLDSRLRDARASGLYQCLHHLLIDINVTAFVLSLSWLTNVTAGHTKKVTSNAITLIGYCVGNSAGPFTWQEQYELRRRDMEERDTIYDDVSIEVLLPDGTHVEKKVEKVRVHLTMHNLIRMRGRP
ncbi:uncharacterized protein LAESUDRAFT_716383 [Laetiporus sulphureus 93-53]|uniref:Uncharacterized protein n=1 Tax=Laetiporus sulphureus 93-53 TaxID=1314785 RepID=A0A165CPT5_9APHY|nr:uncharacterized protein LAESUDRAFT_716383 [Laetiporus sulphureus 93-53]KZT03199.1 hypothetical protein LAESUDRAFT_716383 [Laetiporus sulphureus 93-53]